MKATNRLYTDGVVRRKPVFGYYDWDELKSLLKTSYLYVHCATIEIEGLSCVEAIQQGVVPVIADSRLSATSQFAIVPQSIFPVKDSKALAERIDWWIEHPEERAHMSREYAESDKSIFSKVCRILLDVCTLLDRLSEEQRPLYKHTAEG